MAQVKVTAVKKDGDINLKEEKAISDKMSKLLIEEAEVRKEIRDKYGERLEAIVAEQDEITAAVVDKCRKASKDWTATKLPVGIRFAWRLGGNVFSLDQSKIAKVPKALYDKNVSYRLKTVEVEKYIKANGRVPAGITAAKRDGSPAMTLSGDIKAKLDELRS